MSTVASPSASPKCDLCDRPAVAIWSGDYATRCREHLTSRMIEIQSELGVVFGRGTNG